MHHLFQRSDYDVDNGDPEKQIRRSVFVSGNYQPNDQYATKKKNRFDTPIRTLQIERLANQNPIDFSQILSWLRHESLQLS